MNRTKFEIACTRENIDWVNKNLDSRDFRIDVDRIVIYYFNEQQKIDIMDAIINL